MGPRDKPGDDEARELAEGNERMLFMVIERFKDQDPEPIYRRLAESGRAMPEGLTYVDSWIEAGFDRCFQLMACDDVGLLQDWILGWRDLMSFEIVPVSPSKEVRALMARRMDEARGLDESP